MRFIKKSNITQIEYLARHYKEFELFITREDVWKNNLKEIIAKLQKKEACKSSYFNRAKCCYVYFINLRELINTKLGTLPFESKESLISHILAALEKFLGRGLALRFISFLNYIFAF